MKIFFISDTHFFHNNIIDYCNRPFKDVEEMNNALIGNWNSVVNDEDLVYFLGDFALGHDVETIYKSYSKILKGHINFLRGNHDRSSASVKKYFNVIETGETVSYKGYNFILSHQPLFDSQIPRGFINIHGHIHDKPLSRSQYNIDCHINVSADVIDFTPISVDSLIDKIVKERKIPREQGINILRGDVKMRKLATIQTISNIEPIPDADAIEVATIKGWKVVVRKDEFSVGEKVIYFEIDSLIPRTSVTEFLMKKDEDTEARLRTVKLRGQVSQGLIIPLGQGYIMNEELNGPNATPFGETEGEDLSDILHIEKYEPPVTYGNEGRSIAWPFTLSKTDEERIQNIPEILDEIIEKGIHLCASVKLDGTSMTIVNLPDGIHVAGRNNEFDKTDELAFNNKYWQTALRYKVPEALEAAYNEDHVYYAVQGELVGPGIQGNKMNLSELHYYIFNLFVTEDEGKSWMKLGYKDLIDFCETYNLQHVPYVYTDLDLISVGISSVDDVLKFVEGTYRDDAEGYFPNAKENQQREGLVFRTLDHQFSFKAVSNAFLLKNGE